MIGNNSCWRDRCRVGPGSEHWMYSLKRRLVCYDSPCLYLVPGPAEINSLTKANAVRLLILMDHYVYHD